MNYKYQPINDDSCLDLEDADAAQRAEETRHNHQQRQHEIANVEFEAVCDRIEKQCDC